MGLAALDRLLTPRRQRYAYILGAASWLTWLITVLIGKLPMDAVGRPLGTDYVQFYAAGYSVRAGLGARLYDFPAQWELQRQLVSREMTGLYAFITPPHLAWLYAPFSALPYVLSFVLWSLLGFVLLWAALQLLDTPGRRPFAWTLTWYPVFASISYGQNSLLSLFSLALTYWCWKRERPFAAGLALCLVLYKPQLVLGVAILWLLERDWRALLTFLAGAVVTAILSFRLLPEASAGYLVFARTVLPDLTRWLDFPLWNLHTLRGFWQLLLPGTGRVPDVLTALSALAGLGGFVLLWLRWRGRRPVLYAGAIALTWWLTPHAMIYDLVILLIPACLLWQELPEHRDVWRPVFAIGWFGTLLSVPLSSLQNLALPIVVQVSVPVLCFCLYLAWRQVLNGIGFRFRRNPHVRTDS